MRGMVLTALAAVTLTSPGAVAARDTSAKGQAELQRLIEGRAARDAVSCIPLRDIRSTQVIEGTAIIFETSRSKIYVNRLGRSANALRASDAIVTRTQAGQLCEIDAVDLIDRSSQLPSGSVLLGKFVPYERERL